MKTGRIQRFGIPYSQNNGNLQLMEVATFEGETYKMLYVAPNEGLSEGDLVWGGQPVGTIQSLQFKFPGMTDHVHGEIRDEDGALVDPETKVPNE